MITPLLENRINEVERLLLNADEVCLAIAYVRFSGVRMLRPTYLQSKANFKLLVDTKQRLTDKNALQQLLIDKFEMKKFDGTNIYHPKVWLFRKGSQWRVIVGSMNLSSVALNSSVEACALLEGPEVAKFKEWFDRLWNDTDRVCLLDINKIKALPGASNIPEFEHVPNVFEIDAARVTQSSYKNQDILDFIKAWTHDRVSISPGPSFRKSGWVFRPAHGEINQAKLIELQNVLKSMFGVTDQTFKLTDSSATTVLKHAGVTYSRSSHVTSDRERLIRQQINYLEKLALIEKQSGERTWDVVVLTALGRAYINSLTNQLVDFAESAIMRHRWFGVNIYEFTKAVLLLLPDNKISYGEFFLFLRHGGVVDYSFYNPDDIVKLIITYRQLNTSEKKDIWEQMEKWIDLNDASRSKTSFTNMKNNWAPNIFHDLAICKEFLLQNDVLSYLT